MIFSFMEINIQGCDRNMTEDSKSVESPSENLTNTLKGECAWPKSPKFSWVPEQQFPVICGN